MVLKLLFIQLVLLWIISDYSISASHLRITLHKSEPLRPIIRDNYDSLTISIPSNSWVIISDSIGIEFENEEREYTRNVQVTHTYHFRIDSIPQGTIQIEDLTYIDFSFLGLNKIPKDLFAQKNLKSLNIGYNEFSEQQLVSLGTFISDNNIGLQELFIFGMGFKSSFIEKLSAILPNTTIIYDEMAYFE